MDVVEFLRARLAEDETADVHLYECQLIASGADEGWCDCPMRARVLREVEAKRKALLTRGQGVCDCGEYDNPPMDPATQWTVPIPHHYDCAAYEAARYFAAVYADHPDYQREWAPEETSPTSSPGAPPPSR
jgi:hypothetical protein